MHSGIDVIGLMVCILIALLALAKMIPAGEGEGGRELLGYAILLISAIAALAIYWKVAWRSKGGPPGKSKSEGGG